VADGDRVFLLRLGSQGRGIVGSGMITGPIFRTEHWDGSGRDNRYVPVGWDTLLGPDERLDIAELELAFPAQHWHPQGNGTQVRPEVLDQLEDLWADHLTSLGIHAATGTGKGSGSSGHRGDGQGWQSDPVLRKAVEDAAQDRLERHYRDDLGWHVEDVRYEQRGFDALATKDGEELYLEAKGTLNDGVTVGVSRNEVNFARSNPGRCVMGILSNIRRVEEHAIDPDSGLFRVLDWDPDSGDLEPTDFDWTPGSTG
jgi:hypothetical protein